jgi:putative endonuclease
MPVDQRRTLGRSGEQLAIEHLRARGFTLLARNYRTRRGEIDLIACDDRTLIFVEVKTRRWHTSANRPSNSPLIWISARQLARYRPVALAYLNDKRFARPATHNIRFDAIAVLVDARGSLVELDHIEGLA